MINIQTEWRNLPSYEQLATATGTEDGFVKQQEKYIS